MDMSRIKTIVFILFFLAFFVAGLFPYQMYAQVNVTSFLEAVTFFPEFSGSGDRGKATLKGYVDLRDNVRTANTWFEWGETPALGKRTSSRSVSRSQEFKTSISNLDVNKYYYARASVQDAFGSALGETIRFRISDGDTRVISGAGVIAVPLGGGSIYPAPVTTTSYATVLNYGTTAIINGSVKSDTNISTSGWFEWGETPELGNQTGAKNIGAQTYMDFSEVLYGLKPNTLYYYKAVATNPGGKSFGGILTFFTTQTNSSTYVPPAQTPTTPSSQQSSGGGAAPLIPKPTTPTISDLGLPQAVTYIPEIIRTTQGVQIQFKGFAAVHENKKARQSGNVWFEWGETPALGERTTAQTFGGQATFLSKERFTGFTPEKIYYYRAAVQDPLGVAYGDIVSFSVPEGGGGAVSQTPTLGIFGGGRSIQVVDIRNLDTSIVREGEESETFVDKGDQIAIVSAEEAGGGIFPDTLLGWIVFSALLFASIGLLLYVFELSKKLKEIEDANSNGNSVHPTTV
jgi:hypothetical protein